VNHGCGDGDASFAAPLNDAYERALRVAVGGDRSMHEERLEFLGLEWDVDCDQGTVVGGRDDVYSNADDGWVEVLI
jgi:hypothetical protein